MSTRQNLSYDHDTQYLYLWMFMENSEAFVRCQSIFDYELFDRRLQSTAKFLNDFVTDHSALPTYEVINTATKSQLSKPPTPFTEADYEWLYVDFETFIKHKGLERAINKSIDLVESGQYGSVEDLIKKAVQIALTKDLGTDYFSDPRARLLKIRDGNGQMSTGWKTIDDALYGGMNRGELNIWAAPSGGGKSLFLANLAINFLQQNLTVVYITLELSEELVSQRIDAMITGVSTRQIYKKLDDVELGVKLFQKKAGSLQVKYLPSGKNANDIRAYLKEFEVKTGKKVDVLLIDYLDLLMPISQKISAENLFMKDKYVSEELRNLAVEKNCILNTASQINRSGVEETEYNHTHISGGLSKIQTADNVFGIYVSLAMKEKGMYQVQFMKTRNSAGEGKRIDLDINIDSLRITDPQDGMSFADHQAAKSSQFMSNLNRTSTVVAPDPTAGTPVKTPKANIEGAKLRGMINSISNPIDQF